jgi:hypothetical protein
MPDSWQGIEDKPNIQTSEAAGGGKRRKGPSTGFEGRKEDTAIVDSEAMKAAKKTGKTVLPSSSGKTTRS